MGYTKNDRSRLKDLLENVLGEFLTDQTKNIGLVSDRIIDGLEGLNLSGSDTQADQEPVIDHAGKQDTESIGQLKVNYANLKQQRDDLLLVLNSISDMVLYHDMDNRLLWVNKAAAESICGNTKDIIGDYCYSHFGQGDSICPNCPVEETKRTLKPVSSIKHGAEGRVCRINSFPVFNPKGEPIGVVETAHDISDRIEVEEQVKRLASMLDMAPSAIAVHDYQGNFLYINQRQLEIHGYTYEEMMDLGMYNMMVPEYRERVPERLEYIHEHGEISFETAHIKKDGSVFPLKTYVKRVEWKGGTALLSIATDITEQKNVESRMAWLNALLENSDNIAVVKDSNLRILATNQALAHATGRQSVDELIGKTDEQVFGIPATQEPIRSYMEDELNAQKLPKGEYLIKEEKFIRADGQERIILTKKYPIYDSKDNLIATGNISTDITDSKRVKDELEQQNRLLSTLLENLQVGVFMVEAPSGKPLLANQRAVSILGKGVDPEVSLSNLTETYNAYLAGTNELYSTERLPIVNALNGRTTHIEDMEVLQPNGERVLLEVFGIPVRDSKGEIIAGLVNFSDITERRKAQETIEQERKLLRTLIDNLPDAIYVKDTQSRKVIANLADCINLGLSSEADIVGRNDFDIFPPEVALPFYQDDQYVITTGKPVVNREEKLIKANGEVLWLLTTKLPLMDSTGKIIGLLGVGRDITQQRIAVDALKDSQQFIENILNTVPVRVFWKDKDLKFLGCNLAFAMDAGLKSPQDLIGKDDSMMVWADLAAKYQEDDRRVMVERTPKIGYEEPQTTAEGTTRWLRANKVPLINSKGEVFGTLGTYEDITESRKAEEKLRESHRFFIHALDMLFISDFDGIFNNLNPSWTQTLGWSEEELQSKPFFEHAHPDDREELEIIVKSRQQVDLLYNRYLCKDGSYKWLSWSIFPYPDEEVFFGVARDVTQQKQIEERLKEQNEEYLALNEELTESSMRVMRINNDLEVARLKAEESDRLKTAFLANMSHEIRTPMNSIIGFSEILLQPNLNPDKQRHFTQIINSACHNLLSVINDVIDISKIETGQVEVFEHSLTINKLLRRTHSIYATEASRKGVEVHVELGLSDAQSTVSVDESKLTQILNNLVSNAVKFTETGSVTISYTLADGMLRFCIRDTGIGIAESNLELIFQRFRQVELTDSRKYGGTGLGLAIAKAFVDLFDGRIWVESELGKGSSFYFSVPYKPTDQSVVDQSHQVPSVSFKGKRVLLAEDEEANHILIKEYLEQTGVDIVIANNGIEAIDLYNDNQNVDAILMDVKMPVMNGIDAIKCIRGISTTVPIIALTAYTLAGDMEKCIEAGASDYLPKPVVKVDLLNTLGKYLIK